MHRQHLPNRERWKADRFVLAICVFDKLLNSYVESYD